MYLKLKRNYCLRSWMNYPFSIDNILANAEPFPISQEEVKVLSTVFEYEKHKELSDKLMSMGMLEMCAANDDIEAVQKWIDYGCLYFPYVIFSITGKCNYRCRHCHVSAPGDKLGEMSFAQIERYIREFKSCGLKNITLIGGEPLVHPDFLKIAEKIVSEGLFVSSIYTNGSLVDTKLLDSLEALNIKPVFQISYDGYGNHDRMRGIKGAEKQFFRALKLLKSRGYYVSCYMSLTKDSVSTLENTLDILTQNNVDKLVIFPPVNCGNWAERPDSEKLDHLEILHAYSEFIPKYIQKGFPMDMLLKRTATFDAQKKKYALFYEFAAHGENQDEANICRNFKKELNISPQGYLSPCYGLMGDDSFIKTMPNLNEMSLREALTDSEFVKYVTLTSSDILNHNEKCTNCIYKSKCGGGCRLSAYLNNHSFMSCDPIMCSMLENGYDVLLKNCIHKAYLNYKTKTM